MDDPRTHPEDWNPAEPGTVEERIARQAEVAGSCPVAWTEHRGGSWSVLRYNDVTKIARDPATFSNALRPRYGVSLAPLEVDPPEHTAWRRALQAFFMPDNVRRIEATIRPAAVAIIDRLVAQGEGDLARELSWPLPVFGLCALIDAPPSEWENLKRLSENTLLMDSPRPEDQEKARLSHEALLELARQMIAARRKDPRDPAGDVISAMLAVSDSLGETNDERAAGNLRLLLSAGHNSTTSAIGNVLLHLAQNPGDQAHLRANPSTIPAAIEELLRLNTPVVEMPRYAKVDTEFAGRQIAAGEKIGLFFSAANRDPEQFAEPDVCKLDRSPNRHVTFGMGIHTCLGAPMARMEIRIAVEELLARTSGFELAGAPRRPPFHRIGVDELPVRFHR